MYLARARCTVRDWRLEDAPALSKHADNRKIWINVRDRFPSPYTIEDAEQWVRHCARALPATDFAVEVDGEVAGTTRQLRVTLEPGCLLVRVPAGNDG